MRTRSAILDLTRREGDRMREARRLPHEEAIRPSRGPGGGGAFPAVVTEIDIDDDDEDDVFMTVPIKCRRFTLGELDEDVTEKGDPILVLPLLHGRKPLNWKDFENGPFSFKLYHPQIDEGDVVMVKKIPDMKVTLAYLGTPSMEPSEDSPVVDHFIVSRTYVKWDKRSALPPPCA